MGVDSRLVAVKRIYKKTRAGERILEKDNAIEKFLDRWNISQARYERIKACAHEDNEPTNRLQGVETPTGLSVHRFLKECADLDVEKKNNGTNLAAYGDWTTDELPRDRQLYNTFATFAGGALGRCEGLYGAWEHDIRPILLDMGTFINVLGCHMTPTTCGKRLDLLSAAMELSPSIDHEGEFAEAYQTLQKAKRKLRVRCKIYDEAKNEQTSIECEWPELVRRVKEHFGEESKEYLYVSLWRNMPYRGDLHELTINPEDRTVHEADKSKKNFILVDEEKCTIVVHDHKTAKQWGTKVDELDPDVCELVRQHIVKHGLEDGDYLLGQRKLSEWISDFLVAIGVKKDEHRGLSLLRHIWVSTFVNTARAQYKSGEITIDEYVDARQRLCDLMCHEPEANRKYLNKLAAPAE